MRTCAEPKCDKPAVAHFALKFGRNCWLCAEHYDELARKAMDSARNGLESARELCKNSGIRF